jgi:putative endonuclease
MFYFYIIYSANLDKYYYGSAEDLTDRIKKHNTNHSGFTGPSNDWVLKYKESFPTKSQAYKREFEVKKWKSRRRVERLIQTGSEHPD